MDDVQDQLEAEEPPYQPTASYQAEPGTRFGWTDRDGTAHTGAADEAGVWTPDSWHAEQVAISMGLPVAEVTAEAPTAPTTAKGAKAGTKGTDTADQPAAGASVADGPPAGPDTNSKE